MALVAWEVGHFDHPSANVLSQIVLRGSGRFDFTIVSRSCHPEVRRLARWRRVQIPDKPFRLRWGAFFLAAPVQVRRARPDLIHSWAAAPIIPNHVDLASLAMLQAGYHAAAGGRPPGAGPGWRAGRALKLGLERWSYGRRCKLLDVDTEQARSALRQLVPGASVLVTPRVIDTDRFRPDADDRAQVRSELEVTDGDLVALFVGRDPNLKGLDLAIEGLALAWRRGADRLELWVAGTSDPEPWRRLAARRGVADRIRFLGNRRDIERFYRGADLLLLPTLYEHFSRAAHEAAATELPLVATTVGGIAGLIDDGAGIAVERSPDSVADALQRIVADPALRKRMGKRGRELCARFTPERSTDRYLELYEQLLAAKG